MVARVPRGGPGKDVGRQLWGVRVRGRAGSQVFMAGGGDGGCCWPGRYKKKNVNLNATRHPPCNSR